MVYTSVMLNFKEGERFAKDTWIDPANIGDLEAIVKINSQLHMDLPNFIWDQKEWILEEIQNGNFFVFRDNGSIGGAICFSADENELEIESLSVSGYEQGKGIGKKLVEFAIEAARQKGIKKVTVESFPGYGVKDFYLKCGFVPDDPPTDIFEGEIFNRFVANI